MRRTIELMLVMGLMGCAAAQAPAGTGGTSGTSISDGGSTASSTSGSMGGVAWTDSNGTFVSGGARPIVFDQQGYIWQIDQETGAPEGLQYARPPVAGKFIYASTDCSGTPIGVEVYTAPGPFPIPSPREVFGAFNGFLPDGGQQYVNIVRKDHSSLTNISYNSVGFSATDACSATEGSSFSGIQASDYTQVTPPAQVFVGPLHQEQM